MRRSIRSQILIPLVVIQALATCATTLATAALAARRSERQVIDRLDGVVEALGRANFPYTEGVLARMRGLSGAEFIAYGADGQAAASSLAGLGRTPPPLSDFDGTARLKSLGEAPTVLLGGVRYFAVVLPASGRPPSESLLVLYPETSWRQARREAATPPLLLGGGALAIMVGVSGWIVHRITDRIQGVERRVARIAEGDFERLDPGDDQDEIGDLERSIDAMCLQLANMRWTIRQSERARLLAQLGAGLAHQMRNALTGTRMSVQLHARRCPGPPGDRSLDVALKQLTMIEEQVKGLLSLGRVEDRPPSACDVGQVLGEVALLVGSAGEHAKVAVEVRGGQGELQVMAEESALRAAVLNLALNAIEAAGGGGSVRLEAVRDGELAVIEVIDTGPGPPPELSGVIFESFATSKPEGVGLGLALARHVVDQYGGTLSWDRFGGETCFRLAMPRVGLTGEEDA